jgi:hypothetical protein
MRGQVCHSQLLLLLPAQSFSLLNPAGLVTVFYCLRFETPLAWRARSPYLYPPGTGWPGYAPRHWVPFSSPRTTRRAMVELFEPSSTQAAPTTDWNGSLLNRLSNSCLLYSLRADPIESTVSNSSLLWHHVLLSAETCLSVIP